jgi:excisionase family DNA binding protein
VSILKVLREKTELLNVAELAALLRVAEDTIQGWARRQQIPSIRVGKVIRFDGNMLAAWIELQGAATHPIINVFLHPRAPGNPADYQMLRSDLGERAPKEVVPTPSKTQPGENAKAEAQQPE